MAAKTWYFHFRDNLGRSRIAVVKNVTELSDAKKIFKARYHDIKITRVEAVEKVE